MDPDDPVEAVGGDGEGPVAVQPEPALEVPEGVLVGHELDAARPAVVVEGVQVVGGVGIGVAPDVLVAGVGEGVLHVQLELVDLPARQPVDEVAQGLACVGTRSRDTSSMTPRTAKSGQSSIRHAGRVPSAAPLGCVGAVAQLGQGGPAVAEAGLVGADHAHGVVGDLEAVSLRRRARRRALSTGSRSGTRRPSGAAS